MHPVRRCISHTIPPTTFHVSLLNSLLPDELLLCCSSFSPEALVSVLSFQATPYLYTFKAHGLTDVMIETSSWTSCVQYSSSSNALFSSLFHSTVSLHTLTHTHACTHSLTHTTQQVEFYSLSCLFVFVRLCFTFITIITIWIRFTFLSPFFHILITIGISPVIITFIVLFFLF